MNLMKKFINYESFDPIKNTMEQKEFDKRNLSMMIMPLFAS